MKNLSIISGLAIEVGPIAHGTLNSELYFKVTKVLEGIFDALEHMNTKADLFNTLTNTEKLNPKNFYGLGTTLPIYENFKTVDFPRNPQGEIIAMVHPERNGKDWMEVKKGDPLFLGFQQEKVYPLEEESSLVAIFINEAAYYEKKQAMRFVKPSMHFVM